MIYPLEKYNCAWAAQKIMKHLFLPADIWFDITKGEIFVLTQRMSVNVTT